MSQNIHVFRECGIDMTLDEDEAKRILSHVLQDLGHSEFEINIILFEDEALREMKQDYFGQDVYTDIISFNIDQDPLEGELYISPERIRQNAEKFAQAADREFARILIHGACHLCGYDDISDEDKQEMTALENRFLTQYYDK